jgi:hypothetical protein
MFSWNKLIDGKLDYKKTQRNKQWWKQRKKDVMKCTKVTKVKNNDEVLLNDSLKKQW